MVDNQHRQISGYRDLTEADIALINRCKAMAAEVGTLTSEIQGRSGTDLRSAAIARTELQTGFMWLIRSIAQPDGFG